MGMASTERVAEDYHSPEQGTGWWARQMPSLRFYRKMAGVVFRANRMCKRGVYTDEAWVGSSCGIVDALESVGVKVHIEGVEHLKAVEGSCVLLGNHMSTLETFVLPWAARTKLPLTFVVKDSLMRYPVFKEVLGSRDPVVVSRNNPKEDLMTVLTDGEARLRSGTSVTIFPQTTRTLVFDPKQFNTIGVKLARRAAVPVVPVAIKSDAWGSDGWPVKEFGKIRPAIPVHFEFGAPMEIKGSGKEENAVAARFIAERLKSWGAEVRGY